MTLQPSPTRSCLSVDRFVARAFVSVWSTRSICKGSAPSVASSGPCPPDPTATQCCQSDGKDSESPRLRYGSEIDAVQTIYYRCDVLGVERNEFQRNRLASECGNVGDRVSSTRVRVGCRRALGVGDV